MIGVAEARDKGGGGSDGGGGAGTDQRRPNMKQQIQWNSNLKCKCANEVRNENANANEVRNENE